MPAGQRLAHGNRLPETTTQMAFRSFTCKTLFLWLPVFWVHTQNRSIQIYLYDETQSPRAQRQEILCLPGNVHKQSALHL